jgi:hypothetical protein
MAKSKGYSVKHGFGAKTVDGETIFVTREHEGRLGDLLSAADLRRHVEAGNLAEFDLDAGNPSEAVTADAATEGFVTTTDAAPRRRSGRN